MLTGNGGANVGYESGPEHQSNGFAAPAGQQKRRDGSLNRDNPFRDALQSKGDIYKNVKFNAIFFSFKWSK
jgi:hypothetical protein